MRTTYYIYGLINPAINELFYIGATISYEWRLKNHIGSKAKYNLVSHYSKFHGIIPKIILLEKIIAYPVYIQHPPAKILKIENYWITELRINGIALLNRLTIPGKEDEFKELAKERIDILNKLLNKQFEQLAISDYKNNSD